MSPLKKIINSAMKKASLRRSKNEADSGSPDVGFSEDEDELE